MRIDDGPWAEATLGVDLGPDAWRPWSMSWRATPGRHELRVRCRTTTGQWQEQGTTTPYPHGVRGIHAVTVHVGGSWLGAGVRRLAGDAAARLSWAARSVAAWRQPTGAAHPR